MDWEQVFASFVQSPENVNPNQASYRNLIERWIPDLLREGVHLHTSQGDCDITFTNICFAKPSAFNKRANMPQTPSLARRLNGTYLSDLIVDIVVNYNGKTEVLKKRKLFGIPVMVQSKLCYLHNTSDQEKVRLGECPYSIGGQFICNGNPKVIIPHQRPVQNQLLTFDDGGGAVRVEIKSSINEKLKPIRVASVFLSKTNAVMVDWKFLKTPLPLSLIFRALGKLSDREIAECMFYQSFPDNEDIIRKTLLHPLSTSALSVHDALLVVGRNSNIRPNEEQALDDDFMIYRATEMINKYLLPHCGEDPLKKLWFLSIMCRQLLRAVNDPTQRTDRDSLVYKRVDCVGPKMLQILRQGFIYLVKTMRDEVLKNFVGNKPLSDLLSRIDEVVTSNKIEKSIIKGVSTGNWFTTPNQATKSANTGVSQQLNMLSYSAQLSHIRRNQSPLEQQSSKNVPRREINGTQFPFLCIFETPEGANIGTRTNLSLMTTISTDSSSEPILFCLHHLGMVAITDTEPKEYRDETMVFVNGDLVGLIQNPAKVAYILEYMTYFKLTNRINKKVGLYWDVEQNKLNINSDSGRYIVPLFRVDPDNHLCIENWLKAIPDLPLEMDVLTSPLQDEDVVISNMVFNKKPLNTHDLPLETLPPIEYVDPEQLQGCLVADTPQKLFNGQTFRPSKASEYLMEGCMTLVVEQAYSKEAVMSFLDTDEAEIFDTTVQEIQVIDSVERKVNLVLSKAYSDLEPKEKLVVTNLNRYVSGDFEVYTHALIHPSQILGFVASCIPFSNHSPSPRNCYQSSMGKQALGLPFTNNHERWDTMNVLMYNATRPMVFSKTATATKVYDLPASKLTLLSFCNYFNYNQEDSIIFQRECGEAGGFNTFAYRTYTAIMRLMSSSSKEGVESFLVSESNKTISRKTSKFDHNRYHAIGPIQRNGVQMPVVGTYVRQDDVVIPRCVPKKSANGQCIYEDKSKTVRTNGDGVITKVMYEEDSEGQRCMKVQICEIGSQIPQEGAKFATMHAQKGTIGMVIPKANNLTFGDGSSPEILMNPHAMPSRMTVNLILEMVTGNWSVATGNKGDCTPFIPFDRERVAKESAFMGLDPNGNNLSFNGITGEPQCIMSGWVNYQRLKHQPKDKIHARASGPRQSVTKQPTEGRMRNGGLRIGHMERDALDAHGAAFMQREFMCDNSDRADHYYNRETGSYLSVDSNNGVFNNGTVRSYQQAIEATHSYTTSVAIRELTQAGIRFAPRFEKLDC